MTRQAEIRVGLLGSGSMARTRAASILAAPGIRLVTIASRNRHTAEELAATCGCEYQEDVQELFVRDDLDALIVCTHNAAHGEHAIAALKRGWHTLVEYPLALNPEQGAAAAQLARERKLVLQVGYEQIRLGPHQAVGEAIGRYGPPLALEMQVNWKGGETRSPFRNRLIGGTPAQAKSYYLYAALEWLGSTTQYDSHTRYQGLEPDGHYGAAVQHISLCYPGSLASLSWVVGPDPGVRQRIRIELSWAERTLLSDGRTVLERGTEGERTLPIVHTHWTEATAEGLAEFLTAIRATERTLSQSRLNEPGFPAGNLAQVQQEIPPWAPSPEHTHLERAVLAAHIAAG